MQNPVKRFRYRGSMETAIHLVTINPTNTTAKESIPTPISNIAIAVLVIKNGKAVIMIPIPATSNASVTAAATTNPMIGNPKKTAAATAIPISSVIRRPIISPSLPRTGAKAADDIAIARAVHVVLL